MNEQQCRICLQFDDCRFNLNDKIGDRFIWQVINRIADVSVAVEDSFPQWICWTCYEKLNQTVDLLLQIEKSDNILHDNKIECVTLIKTEEDLFIKQECQEDTTEIYEAKVINEDENKSNDLEAVTSSKSQTLNRSLPKKRKRKRKVIEYRCCICLLTVSNEKDLLSHMNLLHTLEVKNNMDQKTSTQYKRECKYCKAKFRLMKSLRQHFEDPKYQEPKKNRVEEYRKRKMNENKEDQRVVCTICGKVYSCKGQQREHEIRIHAEHFPIPCTYPGCNRRFAAEFLMRRHLRSHGEKTFICNICGKGFLRKKCWISHSYLHKDVKRYQCAHCPRTFTYKQILRRHVESHVQEIIFPCDQCEKTYKWESDLKKHIQYVHEGKAPYKCKHCDKGYFSSSSRKYHQDRCQMEVLINHLQ